MDPNVTRRLPSRTMNCPWRFQLFVFHCESSLTDLKSDQANWRVQPMGPTPVKIESWSPWRVILTLPATDIRHQEMRNMEPKRNGRPKSDMPMLKRPCTICVP